MDKINVRMSIADGKTESWEKTIKEGNITKCIRVEEVENGFITSYNEYGRKSKSKNNPDGEYYDITKKYISKNNPLESKTQDKSKSKSVSKESTEEVDAKILAMIQGNNEFNFD